jgi:calcium-dependent protein kinase
MAPEVLSSQVTPASDLWSAGVMAHQLLTGRLPFDDHRNPFAASISAVWRSVLSDKVSYNMPW